jgi:hypothetical protein
VRVERGEEARRVQLAPEDCDDGRCVDHH